MKVSAWWLLLVLVLSLAVAYLFFKFVYTPSETVTIGKRKNYNVITLALPNNPNPAVFGPKYWKAFETVAENIPCPSCRDKAVPFISFFHDIVNVKTDKPIFNPDNFNKTLDFISTLKKA